MALKEKELRDNLERVGAGQCRTLAAALARAGLGLSPARAARREVRAQEGEGGRRLSRASGALRRRCHALRRARGSGGRADHSRSRSSWERSRSASRCRRSRWRWRTTPRRWCCGCCETPTRAGSREAARLRRAPRRAALSADRRARIRVRRELAMAPLDAGLTSLTTHCRISVSSSSSLRPTSSRSTAPSIRRWSRARSSCCAQRRTRGCSISTAGSATSRSRSPVGRRTSSAWRASAAWSSGRATTHAATDSPTWNFTSATCPSRRSSPPAWLARALHPRAARPAAGRRRAGMLAAIARLAPGAGAVHLLPSGQPRAGSGHAGARARLHSRAAGVVDMFPHTAHVESLALLDDAP